ncbi:uncharacterized protein PV06_10464 [Exophiala oligosperma]|uniref:Uncharacterized protein n=1 Tax=Exophiala oligosperma TaxID=215243 RepID=A0A0D2D279_9EURO|nr:uncharacterized protein PV06_10464 [Exophiala oligosperma]KIW37423.1 hypothetical protein PV06_10464 [Exophiala oligosperma]
MTSLRLRHPFRSKQVLSSNTDEYWFGIAFFSFDGSEHHPCGENVRQTFSQNIFVVPYWQKFERRITTVYITRGLQGSACLPCISFYSISTDRSTSCVISQQSYKSTR